MGKKYLKMNSQALRLVVLTFAIVLLMLGITATGIFDVASYVLTVAKIGAVIVLFVDIGLIAIIKGKGKGIGLATSIELIIGGLVFLEIFLSLIGYSSATLSQFSGWILLAFGIVFGIEAFAR